MNGLDKIQWLEILNRKILIDNQAHIYEAYLNECSPKVSYFRARKFNQRLDPFIYDFGPPETRFDGRYSMYGRIFYLSCNQQTAIDEIGAEPKDAVLVAEFEGSFENKWFQASPNLNSKYFEINAPSEAIEFQLDLMRSLYDTEHMSLSDEYCHFSSFYEAITAQATRFENIPV